MFPIALNLVASLPALLTMTLAAFVAFGLVRHAHALQANVRLRWLGGAAAVLAAGTASLQLLGPWVFSGVGSPAYNAWLLALADSSALGLCGAAIATAARRPFGMARVAAGGALAGLATLLVPMIDLWALGLQFHPVDAAPGLVLGLMVAEVGAVAAFAVHFDTGRLGGARVGFWQTVSAALLGMSGIVVQLIIDRAATAPAVRATAGSFDLSPPYVAVFAGAGALALLVGAEILRRTDQHLRESLAAARSQLQASSARDSLTGVPSRQSFEGTLAQAVRKADDRRGRLALLLVAIDGMTTLNLTHGLHGGDLALRQIARRLLALAPPHMVARLHGDEFLVLLPDDPREPEATEMSGRILKALREPLSIEGHEAALSCSIGIAFYPHQGTLQQLIANASVAMRAAKRSGGDTHAFFDARLVRDETDRVELLRDLRLAIERRQLELYYQPKVHAPSAQITGAEALVRWNHPARGIISPDVFIPLAERHGLIIALGDWVIEQACRQARAWRDEGLRMRVAINLSPLQLKQPDLVRKIAGALSRHQINPDLLTCEITESVAMDDTEATRKVFAALSEIGVHLSIDDFGSGYSNLANLRKLPAGELKIDRSFVSDLVTSEEARTVVRAVVDLAKSLDRTVVAEGVETDAQFQILRDLGCGELQGFLFAKPMTAKSLGLWAMNDVGPRTIEFRASLFKDTAVTTCA